MPQFIYKQPGPGRNSGIGAVFGTIGSIVGFLVVLSAIGNVGRAVSSSAVSVRNVSNNRAVQDTRPERTVITNNSWEDQRQKFLDQLKERPTLALAEPIKYRPTNIDWDKLEITTFQIRRAKPFTLSELLEEKSISEKHIIPGLEEPQMVLDDDFFDMKPDGLIETDLSLLPRTVQGIIKKTPEKYKTLSDMGLERLFDSYLEYQGLSLRINPVFRGIAKSKMRKQYSNDDNNLIISATQDISDSMQAAETEFFSVNVVEENVITEFHGNGYRQDIISAEMDKYEVTPQIKDIPMKEKAAISEKIIAW